MSKGLLFQILFRGLILELEVVEADEPDYGPVEGLQRPTDL